MRFAPIVLAPVMLLVLTGCIAIDAKGGPVEAVACSAGEARQDVAQMIFGRNIGERLGVSDEDFSRFLEEVVTPRFPDGVTVQDSQGRWLYNGVQYREPGKIVTLILRRQKDRAKLGEIAAAYEQRFHQDAVLILVHPDCVMFHMARKAG
ncbi:MAG: DUF3574 domain-containing protein [Alphaproteobacteria bacterium]|nr:DUF3574 domain-containing protein [Alphaproteobacteria bacterium]